ncbi:poly [ADP-ribose] polymerase tankyrase-2-like [Neocloeon triangulifer]|uniref:poly [ADP-ribose] polymerase tankyrase-2-like n=1 Tax=Neocloeon triangulifer TaxID=2078957 RepID=UPI00286ED2BC|nr:poly [ADP-ribose] polymerase tankyrase-2-like [Neocloeon triangulifer]XP_059470380.1 poly [ADP-ribose] polymerase tankyrase-2-like [Neocloeon triangulifer]XP_059470381.1 poly [ADP-ribose] polymerase tankyrase-2-like [Neocloeon triangulifer]
MHPRRWSDGIELEELSPERGGYQFANERVQSTINHDEVESFDIESVYRIKNKYSWNRYRERRAQISQDLGGAWVKEMRLFHGSLHAKKIATEGFDRGFAKKSGMFRDGVYLAEHSSKSNHYAFGAFKNCEKHNDLRCEVCIRRILICRVALGKIYETKRTVKVLPEGYHSVKAIPNDGFLLRPEYIIYHDDQVYPSYLVEYTAKYKKSTAKEECVIA